MILVKGKAGRKATVAQVTINYVRGDEMRKSISELTISRAPRQKRRWATNRNLRLQWARTCMGLKFGGKKLKKKKGTQHQVMFCVLYRRRSSQHASLGFDVLQLGEYWKMLNTPGSFPAEIPISGFAYERCLLFVCGFFFFYLA